MVHLRVRFWILLLGFAVGMGAAPAALAADGSPIGQLRIEVVPSGAAVIVDGQMRGLAPLTALDLPVGRHILRVDKEGFRSQMRSIDIREGETTGFRFVMVREDAPEGTTGEVIDLSAGRSGGRRSSPWSWIALGSGIAMVAGGTTLYVLGSSDWQKVHDADGYGTGGVVGMSTSRARGLVDDGETKRLAGAVLLGVGSAAVATSVVLFILDETVWADSASVDVGRGPRPVSPIILGGPDGAVFGLEGAF